MSHADRHERGPGEPIEAWPGAEGGPGADAGPGAAPGATAGPPADPAGDRRNSGSQALWLMGGIALVIGATLLGGAGALGPLLEPPFPAGLLLGIAVAILGVVVVLRAAARVGPARNDARELIRAVRLIFVAIGLFAAAAGWIVGSALPIVVGLVIVGIDVIETSFLLLVTAARGSDGSAMSPAAPTPPRPDTADGADRQTY